MDLLIYRRGLARIQREQRGLKNAYHHRAIRGHRHHAQHGRFLDPRSAGVNTMSLPRIIRNATSKTVNRKTRATMRAMRTAKPQIKPPTEETPCGNARLIAAAPDLLVALQEIIKEAESAKVFVRSASFDYLQRAADTARTAIAKAEGK